MRTNVSRRGADTPEQAAQEKAKQEQTYDEHGRPIIPEGAQRKFWLDFLID